MDDETTVVGAEHQQSEDEQDDDEFPQIIESACPVCMREVFRGPKWLVCGGCSVFYHAACLGISTQEELENCSSIPCQVCASGRMKDFDDDDGELTIHKPLCQDCKSVLTATQETVMCVDCHKIYHKECVIPDSDAMIVDNSNYKCQNCVRGINNQNEPPNPIRAVRKSPKLKLLTDIPKT